MYASVATRHTCSTIGVYKRDGFDRCFDAVSRAVPGVTPVALARRGFLQRDAGHVCERYNPRLVRIIPRVLADGCHASLLATHRDTCRIPESGSAWFTIRVRLTHERCNGPLGFVFHYIFQYMASLPDLLHDATTHHQVAPQGDERVQCTNGLLHHHHQQQQSKGARPANEEDVSPWHGSQDQARANVDGIAREPSVVGTAQIESFIHSLGFRDFYEFLDHPYLTQQHRQQQQPMKTPCDLNMARRGNCNVLPIRPILSVGMRRGSTCPTIIHLHTR